MLTLNFQNVRDYCRQGANILTASLYFEFGGTAYTSAPTVGFTGGGGTGAAATANVNEWGAVTSYDVTNAGSGYTSAPTVGLTGGGGTGATATAVLSPTGTVKSAAVDTGGTGYTNGTHALVFTGGGGSGATGTATIAGGIVTGVSITGGGTGYTSAPGVSLASTAGAGDGAFAAHAVIGHTIASITATNAGGMTVDFDATGSAYDTGDSLDTIQVQIFDKHGNKVEASSTTATFSVSLGLLNPYDGLDANATIVTANHNIKDGSVHDMYTLKETGYFDFEL